MRNHLQSLRVTLISALALTACSTKNPRYCENNTWCTADPAKRFCDVEGKYQGPGGLTNLCIEDPFRNPDVGPKGGRADAAGIDTGIDGGGPDGQGTGGTGADGAGADGPGEGETSLSPSLVVAPDEYDFGDVRRGQISSARLFTVTNEGNVPSGKIGVSVGGSLHFTVLTNDCGPPLGPGATCILGVAFTPEFVGNLSETLTISSPSADDVATAIGGRGTGSIVTSFETSGGNPSLAIDRTGRPIVAWSDGVPGSIHVYVKRFDGSAWHEVGTGAASGQGISGGSGDGYSPVIAIDGDDQPVVAWNADDQASGVDDVYVKRFNGTAWEEVGLGSASGGGISNTGSIGGAALAIDRDGRPVIAWSDALGDRSQIYVRRFDDASWKEVGSGSATGGGISNTPGFSSDPSLAVDGDGRLLVSWRDSSPGPDQIYVRRFDGTSTWEELGPGSASGGGISALPGDSDDATIVLGGGDQPAVVWTYRFRPTPEEPANEYIYVEVFDVEGNQWIAAGRGAASEDGISDGLDLADDSHVAVDSLGQLVVGWEDEAPNPGQVYVKRFNGQAWKDAANVWSELVGGSATGKGFSATDVHESGDPSVAAGGGRICIAWDEWHATAPKRIGMRCVSDY